MNDPMKRNISGSANGANTSRAGATRITTQAAAPMIAVTGIGSASVTHRMTTAAMIAARRCASGLRFPSGANKSEANASSANKLPSLPRAAPDSAPFGPSISTLAPVGTVMARHFTAAAALGQAPLPSLHDESRPISRIGGGPPARLNYAINKQND